MAYEVMDITKLHSFTGTVKHITTPNAYGIEIVITNEGASVKYPNSYTFKASSKSGTYQTIIGNLSIGDMITVKFFVVGKEGVSKAGKYYHFNEFIIAKDGIQILRKSASSPAEPTVENKEEENPPPDDDIPF